MHRSASYAVGDVDTGERGEQVFAFLAALVSIPLLKTTPPPKHVLGSCWPFSLQSLVPMEALFISHSEWSIDGHMSQVPKRNDTEIWAGVREELPSPLRLGSEQVLLEAIFVPWR